MVCDTDESSTSSHGLSWRLNVVEFIIACGILLNAIYIIMSAVIDNILKEKMCDISNIVLNTCLSLLFV